MLSKELAQNVHRCLVPRLCRPTHESMGMKLMPWRQRICSCSPLTLYIYLHHVFLLTTRYFNGSPTCGKWQLLHL